MWGKAVVLSLLWLQKEMIYKQPERMSPLSSPVMAEK